MKPRRIVEGIEESAALPSGKGDRFAGYALIGLPFRSGHILALRRFPVSSLGPGYTSIWHRDPVGHWTFYSTVPPEQSCSRYFGRPIEGNVHAQIQLAWIGSHHFRVTVADERPLTWDVVLGETVPSRLMNTAARLVPESWWQKQFMLRAMGLAAEIFLSAGKVNLAGRTPNGQDFIANPLQI